MTTSISLRDRGDLVATLPYQLGYHPRRSVVSVGLHGRRVGLTARLDLPDDRASLPAAVAAVVGPFLRERPDVVLLVGYEDEPDESVPLLLALVERLEAERVHVTDVSVVRGGRRFSPTCAEPCCPPEGVPLPPPDEVPAVATYVGLGSAPLASRADLDRSVEHDPDLPRAEDRRVPRERRPARRTAAAAWATLLGPAPPSAPRDVPSPAWVRRVGTATAALTDVPFRDALVAWLVPGLLGRDVLDPPVLAVLERTLPRWGGMGRWPATPADPGERRALVALVVGMCRAVPDSRPDDAAAVCAVAAHLAWSGGDGALARAAVDRALRLRPEYRLAVLLERLLDAGVRPSTVAGPDARTRAG